MAIGPGDIDYGIIESIVDKGPKNIPERDGETFGKLKVFTKEEKEQFREAKGLIERYVQLKDPARPLCLAIFGPPGAGKSFSVEQILAAVNEGRSKEQKIEWVQETFNLTQIGSTFELAELVSRSLVINNSTLPVFFFDEFDAQLDGAPLGWLSWFLAPMHDGEFLLGGTRIPLRKAIYIFAGGTCESYADFSSQADRSFRNAKGPDFVSRLRGYLDILGPNESCGRDYRRAVVLWDAIKNVTRLSTVAQTRGVSTSRLSW